MFERLRAYFSKGQSAGHPSPIERLSFSTLPSLIYAIGDVHGRLDLLLKLEAQITADVTKQKQPALIIMLGDYIDRGPDSCAVLDHLLAPPPDNIKRICLRGNHEEGMLAFLDEPSAKAGWLEMGGRETLFSYGFDIDDFNSSRRERRMLQYKVDSHVPEEHREFLHKLPACAIFSDFVFVHAGLRPGVPMSAQTDEDMLWIRKAFLDQSEDFGFTVVHGHTPLDKPFASSYRICVDTGAYISDHLTAAKIVDGKFVEFLAT